MEKLNETYDSALPPHIVQKETMHSKYGWVCLLDVAGTSSEVTWDREKHPEMNWQQCIFRAFHVLISVSCQILIFEHVPSRHSAPYAVDAKHPKQTRNQALSTTAVTKIPWGTKCSTVCAAINNNTNRTSESMIPAMETLLFKCFLQMIIAANICRIKKDIV